MNALLILGYVWVRERERSFVAHFTISSHKPVSFGEVDVFLQLVRAVSALFKNAASTQLIMQINSCFVVVTLNNLHAHFQLYKTRKVVLNHSFTPLPTHESGWIVHWTQWPVVSSECTQQLTALFRYCTNWHHTNCVLGNWQVENHSTMSEICILKCILSGNQGSMHVWKMSLVSLTLTYQSSICSCISVISSLGEEMSWCSSLGIWQLSHIWRKFTTDKSKIRHPLVVSPLLITRISINLLLVI